MEDYNLRSSGGIGPKNGSFANTTRGSSSIPSPVCDSLNLERVRESIPVYVHYLNLKNTRVKKIRKKILNPIHRNFNILLIDFYDVLLNPSQSFRALMKDLEIYDLEAIVNGMKELKCGYGRSVLIPNVIACDRHNPYRKYFSRLVSASRLVSRLMLLSREYGIDYVFHIVLTMPKQFSEEYAFNVDEGVKLMKKAFKTFIKKLEKEFNGELGYTYNIHVWNNDLQPHFHIHMLMLNGVYGFDKFYRFRPWLDESLIKKLWKESIEHIKGMYKVDKIDVYIAYASLKERSKVMHLVKYASRHPLVDIASYYQDKEYKPLSRAEKDWILTLIYYNNRRVNGGFLRKLKKLLWDIEEEKKRHYCPICGNQAKPDHPSKQDIEELFEKGSLVILYWEPVEKAYYLVYSQNCFYDILLNSGG